MIRRGKRPVGQMKIVVLVGVDIVIDWYAVLWVYLP